MIHIKINKCLKNNKLMIFAILLTVISSQFITSTNVQAAPSKKKVYAIDIGHNVWPNIGAIGIRKEDQLTKEVGTLVISKLRAKGYIVVSTLPTNAYSITDALQRRVDASNRANADLFVSIHFNKYNGSASGSEVFALSKTGRDVGDKVLKNLAALGYRNRGIKSESLYVIKKTKAPALLVEAAYLDNKQDMQRYNAEKIAQAIVNGITQ